MAAGLLAERAAAVRRALIDLIGDAPDNGDQPDWSRFSVDVGQLRALTDFYWSVLPADGIVLAEEARRFVAAEIAKGGQER